MAEKSQKKPEENRWGLSAESLLSRALSPQAKPGDKTATVVVQMGKTALPPKEWKPYFVNSESGLKQTVRVADTETGTKVLVSPRVAEDTEKDPRLKSSLHTRTRDAVGASLGQLERLDVQWAEYQLDVGADELESALLGLEMGLYRFKRVLKGEEAKVKLSLKFKGKPLNAKQLEQGTVLGQAVNLARHLTNLPPNWLNPVTYAQFVEGFFSAFKNVKVEIWDEKRLAAENMNLHLSVGSGSASPPRLVHIRYRPPGAAKRGPFAFVGKGITFDSGGLDIKPSSGMRLMKKDMGGSASVLGLAYWAVRSQAKVSLDFYLALAENSVSGTSFRPSDVVVARSGTSVEIHNTDAEGRLVLADALDVAVTQKEKPRAVIDVATLTGAIKVALGSQLAGLFSNDPKLSAGLSAACLEGGDPAWVMPLVQRYRSQMNSCFADMVNAIDGFGGAVTAALFLEKFVRDVPWAHFDIYAWKDSADGACLESGGSGQMVSGLAEWLQRLK